MQHFGGNPFHFWIWQYVNTLPLMTPAELFINSSEKEIHFSYIQTVFKYCIQMQKDGKRVFRSWKDFRDTLIFEWYLNDIWMMKCYFFGWQKGFRKRRSAHVHIKLESMLIKQLNFHVWNPGHFVSGRADSDLIAWNSQKIIENTSKFRLAKERLNERIIPKVAINPLLF